MKFIHLNIWLLSYANETTPLHHILAPTVRKCIFSVSFGAFVLSSNTRLRLSCGLPAVSLMLCPPRYAARKKYLNPSIALIAICGLSVHEHTILPNDRISYDVSGSYSESMPLAAYTTAPISLKYQPVFDSPHWHCRNLSI